jgi:hypothetical protein
MSNPLSMSMPNLPGMIPNLQSWVYREKDGFKKVGSRPSTAATQRTPANDIKFIDQDDMNGYYNSRPGTSGGNANANTNVNGNVSPVGYYKSALLQSVVQPLSRPQTANPQGYRGATPLFDNSYDFNMYKEDDPKSHSRPSTGKVPKFVEMDKQVARVYAHFFQDRNWDRDGPLGDPQLEKEICRLVTIQYYLVDDELQILEPQVTNAGKFVMLQF